MTITESGDPRDRITNQLPLPASRHVTALEPDQAERFQLLRLCACPSCEGAGKQYLYQEGTLPGGYRHTIRTEVGRCPHCRGEGRTRDLVATCATPEAVGVALVTLGREGEWNECPIGVLDTLGEKGEKWIVRPWLPSARNISDAGRTLAKSKGLTAAGLAGMPPSVRMGAELAAEAEKQEIIRRREQQA